MKLRTSYRLGFATSLALLATAAMDLHSAPLQSSTAGAIQMMDTKFGSIVAAVAALIVVGIAVVIYTNNKLRLINRMNAQLKAKNAEVRQMNIELNTINLESVSMQAELIKTKQKLEEMVEERTRDLLKSNVTLRTQINEREKVEKELEQRAIELTMVNNDLRQFAYIASHDMREPVRMITNYVHLLKKRYCDQLDQQAMEYIDYAYNGAKKIHGLMRDIQKYATIGEKATNTEETDLSDVLKIVETKLNYSDRDKFFTIVRDDLPVVNAARFHMIELFFNLIDNSIKFCDNKHAEIEIKATETGRSFQFSIEDNGIGIDGEYADKVFNIFQRLDRKQNHMGSGIGLSICKRIVEGYKGKIWYESNSKGGTTFHFTLPKYHMLAKVS